MRPNAVGRHVGARGDNLWVRTPNRLMTSRRSTADHVDLRQTVEDCGQPPVTENASDLRKHPLIHNPQAL